MNKYLAVLVFYAIAAALFFIFDKIDPTKHDGGPGLGSLVFVLAMIGVIVYLIIAIVKGFSDRSFFIIALIHLIVLLLCLRMMR